jgi:DNA-binding MarR family transcriptional regulator
MGASAMVTVTTGGRFEQVDLGLDLVPAKRVAHRTYVNYLTYMADGRDVVAAQDLRLAIGRVARRLRQLYATDRDSAANFIELGILVHLQREGPTSPGTLAAGEGVTSQAIAGVVRDLERRALVERTGGQTDRRRVAVAITDAGRELLMSREHAVVDALLRALADEYTLAERHQLESAIPLLNRLAHRL